MKTIVLNASPRKKWNTARLLESAVAGAESVGAETEYVDLYDLNFTGCRSCLLCKRRDAQRCHCFWKDDLSPLIDRIYAADALIIGSPIYFSDVTSQFHAVVERLIFPALSYDDYSSYFRGRIDVGIVLTMNAPQEYYDQTYAPKFSEMFGFFRFLNGSVSILPSCDTLQANDYSKYNMNGFNEEHKKSVRETQFPKDLEAAFQLGAALSRPRE